jgi:hypothetical protein
VLYPVIMLPRAPSNRDERIFVQKRSRACDEGT